MKHTLRMAQFPSLGPAIFPDTGLGILAGRKNMIFGMAPGASGNSVNIPTINRPTVIREASLIVAPSTFQWHTQSPSALSTYVRTGGDNWCNYTSANSLKLRAHSLIQDDSLPAFLTGSAYPAGLVGATPTQAQTILQTYAADTGGYYAGRITHWNVANECFRAADGNAGGFKTTAFWTAYGNSGAYIRDAFNALHTADPTARLYYSDSRGMFVGEDTDRANILAWLTSELAAGTPIHGMAIEGHFKPTNSSNGAGIGTGTFDGTNFPIWIDAIASLGLDMQITELDVADNEFVSAPLSTRDQSVADRLQLLLDVITTRPKVTGITQWDGLFADSWLQGACPRTDGFSQRPAAFDDAGQRVEFARRLVTFFTNTAVR
jgi:endo-1,4-beta-xylanase